MRMNEIMLTEKHEIVSKRILLVEDEKGICKFVKNVLKEYGYIVSEVTSAKDAVEIFSKKNGKFDLLLTDVELPDKTGIELITELLRQKPELCILISSGYSENKFRLDRICEKRFKFIQKPYDVNQLLEVIRETLNRYDK